MILFTYVSGKECMEMSNTDVPFFFCRQKSMYLPDILLLWNLTHDEQYCHYLLEELKITVSALWSGYWGTESGAMSVKVMHKGSCRSTLTLDYGLLDTKLYNTFI